MKFLANVLSFFSLTAGLENSKETLVFFWEEPECPKDLL